jgi:hypothetical protein
MCALPNVASRQCTTNRSNELTGIRINSEEQAIEFEERCGAAGRHVLLRRFLHPKAASHPRAVSQPARGRCHAKSRTADRRSCSSLFSSPAQGSSPPAMQGRPRYPIAAPCVAGEAQRADAQVAMSTLRARMAIAQQAVARSPVALPRQGIPPGSRRSIPAPQLNGTVARCDIDSEKGIVTPPQTRPDQ